MAGYSRSFSYDKDISEISVVKVMQEKDKKREKKFEDKAAKNGNVIL